MSVDDEPVLGRSLDGPGAGRREGRPVAERIRRLVTEQPYAVLCTRGRDQAYGSLVAFAFADDLRTAVFATTTATRKYRLLSESERVAMVVDNRPDRAGDMMKVEAVTATGRAVEIRAGPLLENCSRMLVARHPQLASFVAAETCALFQVEIARFFHVCRFQEVTQWVPGRPR